MTPGGLTILVGSARDDGNTMAAARRLADAAAGRARLIDLAALRLDPYRYGAPGDRDGFAAATDAMLAADGIVFATPVYWYAMSGAMKTLFDRFSDLLLDAAAQRRGRALAGRRARLLATGSDPELPPGFADPFVRTMAFFAIGWDGETYLPCPKGARPAAAAFAAVDRLADWRPRAG